MAPRNTKGSGFSKKCTKTKESKFTSGIPEMEDFRFDCVRHNSSAQFNKSIFELANHIVRAIDCGGRKLAASIQNIQMVLIVVPDEFADNVASMIPLR